MKDLKIQKGIDQIKKVSLTKEEKVKMLHNLSMYADFHQPIPSTFSVFSFWNTPLNRKLSFVLASVMILILAGGSAVYASEQSLPGDLLYPIKTNIIEPIKTALAITLKAKAEIETKFAERRLKEAEILDKVGKLTPEIKKELNDKFDSHVSNFYKIKKQMEKDGSAEENDKIQKEFDNKINPHAEIVNKFSRDSKDIEKADKKEIDKTRNFQENTRNIKTPDNKNASSGDNVKENQ